MEQKVRMAGFGWTQKIEVKPLSQDAAVALGAEMVGEFVIFTVAVFTIYLEVARGKGNEKRKEDIQNDRIISLQNQVSDLHVTTSDLKQQIFSLNGLIEECNKKLEKFDKKK